MHCNVVDSACLDLFRRLMLHSENQKNDAMLGEGIPAGEDMTHWLCCLNSGCSGQWSQLKQSGKSCPWFISLFKPEGNATSVLGLSVDCSNRRGCLKPGQVSHFDEPISCKERQ